MPKVLRTNRGEDGANRPAITNHSTTNDELGLDELAEEVGHCHAESGILKTELEKLRKRFFAALSNKHKAVDRPMKTVYTEETDPIKAEEFVLQYHPGWKITDNRPAGKGRKFILEQDPDLIGDTVVTGDPETPGYVVTRTIRSGTTMIDLDRLKVEQPELYNDVTELPQVERQPKEEKDLTPQQINQIRPYIYEAKKSVALNVRKAKPEDYDESV